MRITDLDAAFIGEHTERGHRQLDSVEGAQGVMFQCPLCAVGKEAGEEDGRRFVRGAHYVICWFRNPWNATVVPDNATPGPGRWERSGDTLETLTLSPSVHLSGEGCGWHGWVEKGEAA